MSDWSRVYFFLKLLRLSRSEPGGTATKLGFEVVKDSSIIDREAFVSECEVKELYKKYEFTDKW